MNEKDISTVEQARFIAKVGKMLHDFLLQSKVDHLNCCCKGSPLGDATVSQIHVVNTIRKCGQVSMTELSGLLNVTPPSATVMVDRLVEKGILIRQHCTEDRRRVVVSVSPDAESYIEGVEASVLNSCLTLVEKLGTDTTRMWCTVLEQVKQILETEFHQSLTFSGGQETEAAGRKRLSGR